MILNDPLQSQKCTDVCQVFIEVAYTAAEVYFIRNSVPMISFLFITAPEGIKIQSNYTQSNPTAKSISSARKLLIE